MNTTNTNDGPPASGRFLILMRHAKSDWSDESLADHDRPLNGRGQRDAPRMANWLADIELLPDVIFSSSSVRTRQTVGLMTAQWTSEPEISFSESLYLSSPETIFQTILGNGGDAQRLMVVAHNPGMAHLVSHLSNQGVEMPTAAIAIFQLGDVVWSELDEGTLNLIHYMRPKAL